MADIFRLTDSNIPYTPMRNLTDSAEMQNTNGVTVHDHGSHFDIGIDGGVQNLTAYGFQDDPNWLIAARPRPLLRLPLPSMPEAPLSSDLRRPRRWVPRRSSSPTRHYQQHCWMLSSMSWAIPLEP